jgi:hypothetical protein
MSRARWILGAIAAVAVFTAGPDAAGADRRRNGAAPASAAAAPSTAEVAPSQGFEAFRLVVERNIFNPNRVGRTRSADEKAVHVDEIALVGTVRNDRGNVAIFDSPDAKYRKAVREGGTLAEFKVQQVTADGVELRRGDTPLALKVAQQLRRVEGADWEVTMNKAAQADPKAMAPGAASTINAARGTETASGDVPADASEVLKRLMKKREKQLK